jgi:hypothetical protein
MTPANPPSLVPRAVETPSSGADLALPPPAQRPIEPALVEKIAALVARAQAGDRAFTSADRSGANAIAAGNKAPAGSESWIAAELVRSALQVARQQSASALSEIDTLAIDHRERAMRDNTLTGFAEIEAGQAQIEAIVAQQTARLDAINR